MQMGDTGRQVNRPAEGGCPCIDQGSRKITKTSHVITNSIMLMTPESYNYTVQQKPRDHPDQLLA